MGRLWPLFLFLLIIPHQTLAIGLAYEYMENKTLHLSAGENYFFKLTFQNTENRTEELMIMLESEIATLVGGERISVPGLTYDRFVYFNITVPPDAVTGARYSIRYEVMPAPAEQDGQVPFTLRYDRTIWVEVSDGVAAVETVILPPSDITEVEQQVQQPSDLGSMSIALLVLVVAVILILLVWRRSDLLARKVIQETKPSPSDGQPTYQVTISPTRMMPVQEITKEAETQTIETIDRQSPLGDGQIKPKQLLAPPDQHFYTSSGMVLTSIDDLRQALKFMDGSTFSHHVTHEKNDFSTWVRHSLHSPDLAGRLADARTRDEMIQVLDEA